MSLTKFFCRRNFNQSLRYLNLSGNKRLQIKSDAPSHAQKQNEKQNEKQNDKLGDKQAPPAKQSLANFVELRQLRVLGLMDVTITATGQASVDIPDENEDRRIRTSMSTVDGMSYGIADTLGKNEHLGMLDVVHDYRHRHGKPEAIFAMFGRAHPPKQLPAGASSNRLAKYLHANFVNAFNTQLAALNSDLKEGVPDALRRAFLKLNQSLHDTLFSSNRKMSQVSTSGANTVIADPSVIRSGASGVALYLFGDKLYAANVGNALAVISRSGSAQAISRKHDPYDRAETERIRAAEGWISPPGLVNDELDISRSFGFYHLMPVVNARPDTCTYDLTDLDEFVIIANRGLWDYVSYQTAVDIARPHQSDPMIAAQKLRDFAISYGAEGSTMIMVITVGDLFKTETSRVRQMTLDSIVDGQVYKHPRRRRDEITDRTITRLKIEVPPPVGHVALVFTDIRNSTHLWEVNPGMPTAMRQHNTLLRRHLRFCGGYEVKTEGDSFICSFPTTLAAVWWCLRVQVELLRESWPLEILECVDGKPVHDSQNRLIAKGLSVRMGIHCGIPFCEPDPVTGRMDYFGPVINRAARIGGSAVGGQIVCSAEVIREINAKIFETEPETEYSEYQTPEAIGAIRQLAPVVIAVGEVKLKGLEVPETLSAVYPAGLESRKDQQETPIDPTSSGSRIQFSVAQMRELGMICLRLETLASSRVFRALPERKGSIQIQGVDNDNEEETATSVVLYGDPNVLLPPMNDKLSDGDLMMILDSLSVRIDNALAAITEKVQYPSGRREALISALQRRGALDERTFNEVMAVLQGI